jgi:peptidoglycan/xylan/chitin deacetylase (PgdA/CDA1 family)
MLPYPVVSPWWIRRIYPSCLWELPPGEGDVYLTFDDGPDPDVTPFVLDVLRMAGAKATFFCIGRNVEAHPDIYERILDQGHAVGNHTHSHLDGWKTSAGEYMADIEKAAGRIRSPLFRPPYGRILGSHIRRLHERDPGMRVVMWTLLSGDFDSSLSKERCCTNVFNNMQPGGIVTFHDSKKAEERLRHTLPLVLERINERGWKAKPIGSENYAAQGSNPGKKIGPG